MTDAADGQLVFLEHVRDDIYRRSLIPPRARVVAAVSGGADSTALLLTLLGLVPEFGWAIFAAHYNHRMRPGADDDEAFVAALCQELGVPLTSARSDSLGPQSSEESARDERLAFLRAAADSCGAHLIATGHTADDLAETVLLNVIRGTGLDGLAGIRWAGGRFVRPLLGRTAREVRAFMEERGQPWRTDESNASTAYARNRLRHQIIPLLEQEFNADVRGALARLAATAGEDAAYLNEQARAKLPHLLISRDSASARFDCAALSDAPVSIARRAVRAVLVELLGSPRDLSFSMVERVLDAAGRPTPAFDAGLGISVMSGASALTLSLPVARREPYDLDLPPGVTDVRQAGVCFHVGEADNQPAAHTLRMQPMPGRLHVRSWRPGDRMRPKGLGGSKKLQDIFTDAKVPARERRRCPVVCVDEEIIWLPGLAIAGCVSRGPLTISLRPLDS